MLHREKNAFSKIYHGFHKISKLYHKQLVFADKFYTMKTLIALFAQNDNSHLNDKLFDGKSAFDRSKEWAASFSDALVYILENKDYTIHALLLDITQKAKENECQRVMFAFADSPFLNKKLSIELLDTHEKYASEYSFADGYPDGFAPEVIDTDSLSLLSSLTAAEALQSAVGEKKVCRDALFSVIKCDINSFEIESVLAPKDYRQYRLHLYCDTKANAKACKILYESSKGIEDVNECADIAVNNADILHTYPAYYRIQLTESVEANDIYTLYPHVFNKVYGALPLEATNENKTKSMSFDKFEKLIKDISDFSESAMISLSFGGESLLYEQFENAVETVLSYKGLSLLIETSGYNITQELAERLSKKCAEVNKEITWIVSIDATDEAMYKKIHAQCKEDAYKKAISAVGILSKYFAKNVYPEFLRINENEEQLEAFFRFWKNAESPSYGNVLIQKYDHGCALLQENKPADLSPLERYPCWHLRRDFIILADGNVPLCQEWQDKSDFIGNAFEEKLSDIWEKSKTSKVIFSERCSLCDEYYTFNF